MADRGLLMLRASVAVVVIVAGCWIVRPAPATRCCISHGSTPALVPMSRRSSVMMPVAGSRMAGCLHGTRRVWLRRRAASRSRATR